MTASFSYFKAPITNKIPFKDISLTDLHNAIKGDYYKPITEKLRRANKTEYRGKKGNTSEYKQLKQSLLPYVTFAGTFKTRKNEDIKSLSGLMCFDFDHIGDPENLKVKLSQEPGILMMFTSPAGDGLKVICKDPMEEDDYKSQYEILRDLFLRKYNLQSDPTQDISRACFICHDANVWVKSEVTPALDWDVPMQPLTEKLIHRLGCEFHNEKHTWTNVDVFLNKPRAMPMLTVDDYRNNGWKLPDNWEEIQNKRKTKIIKS